MVIREGVGAYEQSDLEAMTREELEQLQAWASARFHAHYETHDAGDFEPCRECEYYELLSGAAADLLGGGSNG